MKSKILLFLLLIVGLSLKAQSNSNYIGGFSTSSICSSMVSPAITGGTYDIAKNYFYEYRYIDLLGNAIPGEGWKYITIPAADMGMLSAGRIPIVDRTANYKVEVRRWDGSTYSPYPPSFTVICKASTPSSLLDIYPTSICYNNNIIINGSSVAVGYGSVDYSWTILDTKTNLTKPSPPNGQNLNIVLPPGDYLITRNHSGGCILGGSAYKQVKVFSSSVEGKIGSDQSLSYNQYPVIFTNERLPVGGGPIGYSYQWQKSSNGSSGWSDIDGATYTTYQAPRLTETTYYRRVETDRTCLTSVYSNVIKVHVDIPLQGGQITTQSYTCCYLQELSTFAATEAIGGILPYSYKWYISDDGSNWVPIQNSDAINWKSAPLTKTKYFQRVVTDGEGTTRRTDPIKITVRKEFLPGEIVADQTICKGAQPKVIDQKVEPSGGSESYSFSWEKSTDQQVWGALSLEKERNYQPPALVQTHYYRRIVTDNICGTKKNNSTVLVAGPLVDNGIKYDGVTEICKGTAPITINTKGVSGGGGNYSYQWERSDDEGKNWSPINDSNTADLLPKPIVTNMLFRRKVSSLCESKTSNYVAINVYEVPAPSTNENIYYCKGNNASVVVQNADTKYTYKWYNNEGGFIKQGTSVAYTNLQESMNLFVEALQVNNGCTSIKKPVNLYLENVIADFNANLDKIKLGYPVEFTNNSQNAVSYKWDFNDGSDIISEKNPWHYYNEGSLSESVFYDVKLTATGALGCLDTKVESKMIEVLQFDEKDGRVIEFLDGNIVKVATLDKRILEETTSNTDGKIFVNNPVKDILIITSGENISKVLVYSLSGQLVKSSNKKIVNLSSLKTGIYLVVIETENKNYKQVKIQKL